MTNLLSEIAKKEHELTEHRLQLEKEKEEILASYKEKAYQAIGGMRADLDKKKQVMRAEMEAEVAEIQSALDAKYQMELKHLEDLVLANKEVAKRALMEEVLLNGNR